MRHIMKKFWPKNKILIKPEISVVTPVRDREGFIGKAIQSIINQTFYNWEMVIVNDHSRDRTLEVVKSFAQKDERIKLFNLIKGEGVAVGRNFGARKAQGKIIVVADSDDTNYPNRLETIYNFFQENSDADIFYSNIDLFYADTGKKETRWFQPYNAELLKHINFVPNPGAAYTKKAFKETGGFDTSFKHASEDYDFWLTCQEKELKFGYLEKSLVLMTKHSGSVRSNQIRHKESLERNRRKHNIKVDIEIVKKLARPEVYKFFTSPEKYNLWFGKLEDML